MAEPAAAVRFGLLGPAAGGGWSGARSGRCRAAEQRIVLVVLLLSGGTMVWRPGLSGGFCGMGVRLRNVPAVPTRTYATSTAGTSSARRARTVRDPPAWAIELRAREELDLTEVDGLWRAARGAGDAGSGGTCRRCWTGRRAFGAVSLGRRPLRGARPLGETGKARSSCRPPARRGSDRCLAAPRQAWAS